MSVTTDMLSFSSFGAPLISLGVECLHFDGAAQGVSEIRLMFSSNDAFVTRLSGCEGPAGKLNEPVNGTRAVLTPLAAAFSVCTSELSFRFEAAVTVFSAGLDGLSSSGMLVPRLFFNSLAGVPGGVGVAVTAVATSLGIGTGASVMS